MAGLVPALGFSQSVRSLDTLQKFARNFHRPPRENGFFVGAEMFYPFFPD
jgi:hypothetical protein